MVSTPPQFTWPEAAFLSRSCLAILSSSFITKEALLSRPMSYHDEQLPIKIYACSNDNHLTMYYSSDWPVNQPAAIEGQIGPYPTLLTKKEGAASLSSYAAYDCSLLNESS